MQIQCPPISDALMRYLDEVFPDRAVDPTKDNPDQHFGSVKVVRHLRAVALSQEEEADVST